MNALAAVEQSRSETKIGFDSLQSLTEDVHREFREVKSDAAQAVLCCAENATQLNRIGSGMRK